MFHFLSHHTGKHHTTIPKHMSNSENFTHPEYMVVNDISKGPSVLYHTSYGQPATQGKDQVAKIHPTVCSNTTVPILPIIFIL